MNENIYPMPIRCEAVCLPLTGAYFYDELVTDIDQAKLDIYAIQYQWKWSSHERHSRVQRLGSAILRAKKRGVGVSVLLNNESPGRNLSKINRITNDQLSRGGCAVRMLRTAGLLHTKLWVIDGKVSFIGSHNISSRALGVNEEVSVKIESEKMAGYLLTYFKTLWESR
jgi:phosphatidylserine/phosphatidylglycerophosphate/cardiolipin synthase-like enzyme